MAEQCNQDQKPGAEENAESGRIVIPVTAEEASVQVQRVETGSVAVHVLPLTRKERVDIPLTHEDVRIERVPMNRFVDKAQPARQEDNVTIVPVYEEVLVVERRLMLKEEVRIHRVVGTRRQQHEIELRSEEAQGLRSQSPGRHA